MSMYEGKDEKKKFEIQSFTLCFSFWYCMSNSLLDSFYNLYLNLEILKLAILTELSLYTTEPVELDKPVSDRPDTAMGVQPSPEFNKI